MTIRIYRVMLPLSFLMLAGISQAATPATAAPASASLPAGAQQARPMTPQEAEDFAYILPKIKTGKPYVLNLAEPHQLRIAMRGLLLGNRTPQSAPQTHAALKAAKLTHQREVKGLQGGPQALMALAPQPLKATTAGAPQAIATISNFSDEAQTLYSATGYSSVPGGTTQTTITTQLIDTQTQQVYATQSNTQYGQGTDFSVTVTGKVPSGANLAAVATINTTQGSSNNAVIVSTQGMRPASSASMTAPNYCVRSMLGNQSSNCVVSVNGQTQYQTTSTTLVPNPPPIIICFNRGSQQACDYYNPATRPPTSVFFPSAGSLSFGSTPIDPSFATAGTFTASVIDPVKGGGCVFEDRAPLGTGWSLTDNNTTLQWNLPQLSMTNPTSCLGVSGGRVVNFSFYVEAPLTTGKSGYVSFNSSFTPPAPPGYYGIPQIYLEDSCVAAGSLVRLPDGSHKPIEALSADDAPKVQSATGEPLTVEGTAKGVELHPMVRIKTNLGNSLLITRTHPVLTVHGFVMARDLEVGEGVRTEKGVARITSVTTESYSGQVHSLRLGGLEGGKTERRTHTANGIYIGDSFMQLLLEREEVARLQSDKNHVLRRLPDDKWRAEYKNFLAAHR